MQNKFLDPIDTVVAKMGPYNYEKKVHKKPYGQKRRDAGVPKSAMSEMGGKKNIAMGPSALTR